MEVIELNLQTISHSFPSEIQFACSIGLINTDTPAHLVSSLSSWTFIQMELKTDNRESLCVH